MVSYVIPAAEYRILRIKYYMISDFLLPNFCINLNFPIFSLSVMTRFTLFNSIKGIEINNKTQIWGWSHPTVISEGREEKSCL